MERRSHILQRTGGNAGGPDPAVKAWLDKVIVPALVRGFLANREPASLVLSDTSRDVVPCATGDKESEDIP
jgi:hypothetical protein